MPQKMKLSLWFRVGVEKETRKACSLGDSREGGDTDEPNESARTGDQSSGRNQRGMETAGSSYGAVDVCDERSKHCHYVGLGMAHSHDGPLKGSATAAFVA